ncbi:MAG: hypothetical protein KDD77_03685, partial [Caldilineaceae bacterium]|nr:hypothetical protein [Caldilinea sp.]MCB0066225.1 hypothetical protein [Caldilineaceae bacterium]HRW49059.1 hypothetical protein [Caldilinea sp.]
MNVRSVLYAILIGALMLSLVGCTTVVPAAPAAEAPAGDQAAAPAADTAGKTFEDLVVGYAQIGAESEWRTANTQS